jgi:hypothetical protein
MGKKVGISSDEVVRSGKKNLRSRKLEVRDVY